jgi:two-component system, cell cycle sensor histidine kinase and response regulator CckA
MALFDWPEPQQRPPSAWRSPELSPAAQVNGRGPAFAPDTAAGLRILWSAVTAGSPVIDQELSTASADGDIRDLAISAAPLRSSGGSVDGILTLVADVTDRRRFEAELRRAQRMEAIAQLAGGVAHDFNNLLTLITGYTDLLHRRLEVDDHSIRLVDGVHAAVTRASLLTGQLLSISRRQTARPVILRPVDALRSSAEVLERVLGAGVHLVWALDADAGQVEIDPAQLEQVVLNLAINARDAMPGGGRLDIAVSGVQLDRDQAAALAVSPGRYVRISVADTGVGMDAATSLRCFEPLFTTKGPTHGTGLGLAAVKGVVGETGGAVHVDSFPGRGTTFVVYLPAVTEASSDQANQEPVAAHPCAPLTPDVRTLLVAEDDEPLRHLMSQVLRRDGYQVLVASDGCDAVTVAADWSGTIDAMISDIDMPGMNGSDVAATLLVGRPTMRVLFVSGGTEGSATTALPPSLLAKPFKPSQLLARVRQLLSD